MKSNPCTLLHPNHEGPYDPLCGKAAEEIPSVVACAKENGVSPAQYIRSEEGTYNPETKHFLCDDCFIQEEIKRGGRLVGPRGAQWKCP